MSVSVSPQKVKPKIKKPKIYTCVMHNDDITTMDFVVMAIVTVFNKSAYEAAGIMMHIHNNGSARIGRYCYDIAATKKNAVDKLARSNNFPLITTVEEVDSDEAGRDN
jgi:ATP-dependent Clp protease adaptor protein ClpS